ncbi:MAG: 1-deoxy-D-xylulose-5-phosphate reductoisomerase, partial [Muribaculaceae bacterium]|nr:1-deoxy-D-xylulose-5-phosphate reductoisomerase [Muribaculaceae bacterium]
MKNLVIIGATGSIGLQTLDIVKRHPELYNAKVLIANSRVDRLAELSLLHKPAMAIIADKSLYPRLRQKLDGSGIQTAAGAEAICEAMTRDDVQMIVNATVGYSGLAPTLAAIEAGKDIALANKETLVVAGELVNRRIEASGKTHLYPIDSEHSAIWQCLQGERIEDVNRLVITASGGPFRNTPAELLPQMTAKEALRHPCWNMGAKITIDSATMLNKAFEIIEARWLFGIDANRIVPIVHPQSIVHSMVEFKDGSMKAQLGCPDMRMPISYALGQSERLKGAETPLSFEQIGTLTFEQPDYNKFPCLSLAYKALEAGGNTACVINAANEVAVAAFLGGEIHFTDIYDLIAESLDRTTFIPAPEYEDYVNTDAHTRALAADLLKNKIYKPIIT